MLKKLCVTVGQPARAPQVLQAKQTALAASVTRGNPNDDMKSACGDTYVSIKQLLKLTQCGNLPQSFARDTLAPLITPDTRVHGELKLAIFGPETLLDGIPVGASAG